MHTTRIKNLKNKIKGSESSLSARLLGKDAIPMICESSFTAELEAQAIVGEHTMMADKTKDKTTLITHTNMSDQAGGNSSSTR